MPTTPLATPADLAALLGIDDYTGDQLAHATRLMQSASEAVRDAAGSPISRTRQTITLSSVEGLLIAIPARPVVEVHDVLLDGKQVSDWKAIGPSLWRERPWHIGPIPSVVTIDLTYGYDPVPSRVVDIVCALTAYAMQQTGESGLLGQPAGVIAETLGSYRVTYSNNPGSGQPNAIDVFDINDRTAKWLRRQYGAGSAHVVRS